MPPKTPEFWYPHNGCPPATAHLLRPFSALYDLARRKKLASTQPQFVQIPVLCVGNVVAGGSGKTPTLIALHHLLRTHKLVQNPAFLTRGYGGCITGPELVSSAQYDVKSTGDEPQILMKHGKTIISANRYKGALLAQEHDCDLVMMDDGFQNTTLHKDINILVIDGQRGIGNGLMIPAGPMREPLADALARSSAVMLIGEDLHHIREKIPAGLPLFGAAIEGNFNGDSNARYYGFAGLGDPWKFKQTILGHGLTLCGFEGYPDHHPYTETELEKLLSKAKHENARLITTEKDFMRIPAQYHVDISCYPITLKWENEGLVIDFLKDALHNALLACQNRIKT